MNNKVKRKENSKRKNKLVPRFDKKEVIKLKKEKSNSQENIQKIKRKVEKKQNRKYASGNS